MNISFNPFNIIQNTIPNAKIEFINKYGTTTSKYNALNAFGDQKTVWFYFILIVSFILTTVFFYHSKEEIDKNGNIIELTTIKKTYKLLAWLFMIISIIFSIYSGYMYFFIYYPQYNEWINSLPSEARNQLNIIKTVDMITYNGIQYNRNHPGIKVF